MLNGFNKINLCFILGYCLENVVRKIGFVLGSNKGNKDIIEGEGKPVSAEECHGTCRQTPECQLFTYLVDTKRCLLKMAEAVKPLLDRNIVRRTGHISERKFCNTGG